MKKIKFIKNKKYESINDINECDIKEHSNYLYYIYQKIINGDCTLEQYKIFFNYIED